MVTPVKFSMGIDSVSMPAGFHKKNRPANVSTVVDQKFSPEDTDDVRIRFFYRGMPLSEEGAIAFRDCLSKAPHLIYAYEPDAVVTEASRKELESLRDALDYLAHNQAMRSGKEAIHFQLEELRTLDINGRIVLAVQGWFYAPGTDEPQDHLYGVFFDASPRKEVCHIEELLLEARSWDDFEKHYPLFKQSLDSVRWAR